MAKKASGSRKIGRSTKSGRFVTRKAAKKGAGSALKQDGKPGDPPKTTKG